MKTYRIFVGSCVWDVEATEIIHELGVTLVFENEELIGAIPSNAGVLLIKKSKETKE